MAFPPVQTGLLEPEVEVDKDQVMVGEDVAFDCVVRTEIGTMVQIQWTYTSKEVKRIHKLLVASHRTCEQVSLSVKTKLCVRFSFINLSFYITGH